MPTGDVDGTSDGAIEGAIEGASDAASDRCDARDRWDDPSFLCPEVPFPHTRSVTAVEAGRGCGGGGGADGRGPSQTAEGWPACVYEGGGGDEEGCGQEDEGGHWDVAQDGADGLDIVEW